MSYKSVREILNAVFHSGDSDLKGIFKTDGEVLNMVLDESGDPALKISLANSAELAGLVIGSGGEGSRLDADMLDGKHLFGAGGVFEHGSNENGEFIKFADGTMICSHLFSVSDYSISSGFFGGYRSSGLGWTFPYAFFSPPQTMVSPYSTLSGFAAIATSVSTTVASIVITSISSQTSANRSVSAVAVGKWQ